MINKFKIFISRDDTYIIHKQYLRNMDGSMVDKLNMCKYYLYLGEDVVYPCLIKNEDNLYCSFNKEPKNLRQYA